MKNDTKTLIFKIILAMICVLFLASISISLNDQFQQVSINALPEVPKEGQPIIVTFNLNNNKFYENTIDYEFYANGVLLMKGSETLSQFSRKQYTYIYPESPKVGEKVTFLVKTSSKEELYDESINVPAYPPQIWSSFVSFATISSTQFVDKPYYNAYFIDNENKTNIGAIFSIVLIVLLIYLELTEPLIKNGATKIEMLRERFGALSILLLIIFIGMVFTKVVMILG